VSKKLLPVALLSVLFLLPAADASAKSVSGAELGQILNQCLSSPNGQPFNYGNVWGCCNPAGGWCVICVGEPSADKVCEFSYVRGGQPPQSRAELEAYGVPGSLIQGTRKGDGRKLIDELLEFSK
jgi:hypothetical protein